MFSLDWTTLLGFGGLSTAALLGVAAYFLGAKYVVEALTPLLKGAAEGLVELTKLLWRGFKGLVDTVSDLLMVILIVAATWFGTSMHYKMEIKDLKFVHQQELAKRGKAPSKVQTEGNGWFPFDFR